jgi:signal recognition particle subunit SRP54
LQFVGRRVQRVARGSGRKEHEVKELINKFGMMRNMMMQLGQSTGLLGKIPGIKQVQQMKQLAGIDIEQLMGAMGPMGPGGGGSSRPPARSFDRAKLKKKRQAAKKARKQSKKKR